MTEAVNSEQSSKRITAADLHRETGLSKAYISKLKKEGKLLFTDDADGKSRIEYSAAMEQLKGSIDFNRDAQRQWAETQRKGRAVNLPSITGHTAQSKIDPGNPHNLKDGPAIMLEVGNLNCKDEHIGRETQRSKLIRETYEAYNAELEFKKKCGEYISKQALIEANRLIAGSIRSKFQNLPAKVSARCEGKTSAEIKYILEDEVNAIFTDLYQLGGGTEEK